MIDSEPKGTKKKMRNQLKDCYKNSIPGAHIAQSVHIHCRHTILAHLFFRDFSFPSLFSYSPRLSIYLSLPSLSPSLSLSLSLCLSYFLFLLSCNIALLYFYLGWHYHPVYCVYPASCPLEPGPSGQGRRAADHLLGSRKS